MINTIEDVQLELVLLSSILKLLKPQDITRRLTYSCTYITITYSKKINKNTQLFPDELKFCQIRQTRAALRKKCKKKPPSRNWFEE